MPNYTTVIAGKGVTFSTPEPLSDSELSERFSAIQDNLQAEQPNLTATPPQGQAQPTGELRNTPQSSIPDILAQHPVLGGLMRALVPPLPFAQQGVQAAQAPVSPSPPPQGPQGASGNPTTFTSDLPSIIGSVVLPMLLGGRAGGGLRGMAARTGAGVAGAVAGSPIGHLIQQRLQGVPGPPLSERATNVGTGAAVAGPFAELLGMIGSKIARPLGTVPRGLTAVNEAERVGIPPSPGGVTQSSVVNQLMTRQGTEQIGTAQSAGIKRQMTNKIAAAGGELAPNTLPGEFTTTLKADLRTHINKFNRTPQAMSVEANRIKNITGIDPMTVTEAQLLAKLGSKPNQLGQLAHHVPATANTIERAWLTKLNETLSVKANASGIVPPEVFTAAWEKLTPFSQKAIFGANANSMSRLAKVISQANEASKMASGAPIGRTMSYWQPIAAIIGSAAAIAGHSSGLSPTFLGTTAILSGGPSAFSALLQTRGGIRWLVGAIEASSRGRLTTQVAEGLSRSLVQVIGQEGASSGTPTLPASPQTPPTPPPGMATPRAMTANKFPTRQFAP